ncbi:hypothetical protein P170DRAFT_80734 [Aspergillus steynii IBT 23096]|uniref:Uncharacterized protein n=1 Tax=Aspergillus steynii IBT 23096 TaxID=1392250 RepID=A0A2I2GF90_9EURO|nr:uncharacterized protein P170DRAFT_80734 [Aspergillus steynii IBT 23096]PLB51546.1 hypothetical protein P170DRAFT_80734 [Aspergillus steynii IBT 23096]
MSADDPFSFIDNNNTERKPPKKAHWREKLFSKDRRNKGPDDQQIEAFLAPARSKSVSYGAPPAAAGSRGLPTPRLDVSQRFPSSQELSNTSPTTHPASATDVYSSVNFPKPPKKRNGKALRVKFSDKGPDLIGEGGDESEVPTMEISLHRNSRHTRGPSGGSTDAAPSLPQLQLDTSFGDGHRGITRQKTRHRKDVNDDADQDTTKPKPLLIQNAQDSDFLMSLNLGDKGSRLSFRASPESNSFAQRVRDKMQAEEGRALQQHRYDGPTSPSKENPGQRQAADDRPDSPSSAYDTPPLSETETTPPSNSLRSPVSDVQGSQFSALPPGIGAGTNAQNRSPTKSLPSIPSDSPLDRLSQQLSTREILESSPKSNAQPPKMSLRAVANQIGDTAFTELKAYVAQYEDLIWRSAESVKPLMETSLAEWMRAAVWWFLRGKKRLEVYARASRPSSSSGRPARRTSPDEARQAVVDLGKSLWILENIVSKHPETTRYGAMGVEALLAVASTTGDRLLADLLALHQALLNHLRSLAMSIKRNNIISTIGTDGEAASRGDMSIWVRYPFFAPDVSAVLSGTASRSMLIDQSGKSPDLVHLMPLGDTTRFFSYGSMFVDVYVSSSDDDADQQFSIPCVLSIVRDRGDWYVFAAITSQSELVNVMIQSDRKKGPTWESVDWQVRSHSMRVKLPRGFELDVSFQEEDFKTLWNIVQYTMKTEDSLQPEAGESVVFESTLKMFHYMDPGSQKAFPAEPVERCRLRLFERSITVTEGTGQRSIHQGHRITVLTSPKIKTLSNIRHLLGFKEPIVFGLLRGEDGAPALLIKVKEDGRTRSMLMTFQDDEERSAIHSILLGTMPQETEVKTSDIPIRAYSIEQPADRHTGKPTKTHLQFPAGSVSVIDQEHRLVDHGYGPTILSEHLRAFVATEWGSATDRLNLGPGELKLGLDINNRTGLSLFRPGQQDLTLSLADNLTSPDMPDSLANFMKLATTKPTVRRFDFATVKDLHAFQAAVTGFKVLFDSVASSFTISRRRMVVPITKKWEANMARIQIVQQEKVVQLLAYLNDFHYGKCMNFVLKGTDMLENFGRAGKFGVKIVDAKFALPKNDNDPASDFLCLDMPEYPIEHDDISIAFDSEAGMFSSPTYASCH